MLLGHLYAHNPTEVTDTILKLADSGNWEVREWAASALRRVIGGHFGAVFPTVQAWTVHASPNIRRAAAVGCGSAASSCTSDECRLLLDALTPLLEDDDPYVRKNLGAFAIGDSLLKAQPALVAEWLGRASSHPRAQWNVAMALSSAEAAKHFDLLRELLWKVAADDRTVVRRAVYRAVLNLAKRIPEEIATLLKRGMKTRSDPMSTSKLSPNSGEGSVDGFFVPLRKSESLRDAKGRPERRRHPSCNSFRPVYI